MLLKVTQQVVGIWGKKQKSSRLILGRSKNGLLREWLRILLALSTPGLRLGFLFGAKSDNPTAAKLFFSGVKLHMLQMALLQGPLTLIDNKKSCGNGGCCPISVFA